MSNTQMVNISAMAKGLQASAQQAATVGVAFIKFTKFGDWIHGADEIEAEPDATWMIHPQAFKHGWIAWGDKANGNHGDKLGDISVLATEPLPTEMSLPAVKGKWAQTIAMHLLCLDGMDKDTAVIFNSSSAGGRRAYQGVVNAVIEQINSGSEEVVPVVRLVNDSYTHKEFGKIFTPVIEIVGFKTLNALNALMDALVPGSTSESSDSEEAPGIEDDGAAAEQAELLAAEEAAADEEAKAAAAAQIAAAAKTPTRQRRTRTK